MNQVKELSYNSDTKLFEPYTSRKDKPIEWIAVGLGGGHRQEFDWKCSGCGFEGWWPSPDNPNKLNDACPTCGRKPNG